MSTSLTATKIKDTYGQLLHLDGGITSTLKTVYDGDGTATGLKISTTGIDPTSVTLTSGTANGVAYLNGSKVLTTGSALTFDGTNLGVGGYVSIGTSLITQDNGSGLVTFGQYSAGYTWSLIRPSSDSTGFEFRTNAGNALYQITQSSTNHIWYANAGSEQMRLTSTGLGIGTSSPAYKLDVSGAIQSSVASGNGSIYINNSSLSGKFWTFIPNTSSGESDLLLYYGGSGAGTKLTITSSGNLGLGVTPSAWLSGWKGFELGGLGSGIASNGSSRVQIGTNNYLNGSSSWIYSTSAASTQYIQASGAHYWMQAPSGTAGNAISFTQAMTLDASGQLAIGATTAYNKLDVTGNIGIQGGNSFYLNNSSNNSYAQLQNVGSSGSSALAFSVPNGSERMRIDSSGNVGIGTSSPAAAFAGGTSVGYGALDATGPIITRGALASSLTNGGAFTYYDNGVFIRAFGSSNNGYIGFNTGGGGGGDTERMRIDSSGNVGIGSTNTSTAKLFVQTAGGATNALEVYSPSTTNGARIKLSDNNYSAAIQTVPVGGGTNLAFEVAGSERMRIDSSGNVGIGTSSPGVRLDVQDTAAQLRVTSTTGTNNVSARLTNTGGALYLFRDNSTGSDFSGSSYACGLYASGAYPMVFINNATERMRIDSDGNLLVGTTNAYGKLYVNGTAGNICARFEANATGAVNLIQLINTATSGTNTVVSLNQNGGQVGSITTSNTATAYNTSSDYRLKENIQPMQNALGVVAQLNPVTYTWKADGSDGQGFIAHELQAVVPDCVTGEKDAVDADGKPVYQGIDTSFLVATLTAAIKELKAELDATKAEVAALKAAN